MSTFLSSSAARVHAVRQEVAVRRESAHLAAQAATDERERAMLRGKWHAYDEALCLLDALDRGRRLSHLRRRHWTATEPTGETK